MPPRHRLRMAPAGCGERLAPRRYYGAPRASHHTEYRAGTVRRPTPRLGPAQAASQRARPRSPVRRRSARRAIDVGRDRDQAPQVGLEIASGGISTTTSPSGRMIAPRRRASSATRWPRRSAGSCSPRSIPTMNPRARDLGHLGHRRDLGQQVAEQADLRLQALQRALALEHIETGDRRRAGERVAGERVAVEEGAALVGVAEEPLVDPLGRQRRGERQVAAASGPCRGRGSRARPAPARRRTSSRCGRSRSRPRRRSGSTSWRSQSARAPRRRKPGGCTPDPGGALDQRLDDHRRDLAVVVASTRCEPVGVPGGDRDGRRKAAAGRRRGRGRCRRPRRRRACRRGRRRRGETNDVLPRGWPPRWRQYWNAILSAISTAVEPESE